MTDILELLQQRRAMDLSDLPPAEQATLIGARAQEMLPSTDQLATLLASAKERSGSSEIPRRGPAADG